MARARTCANSLVVGTRKPWGLAVAWLVVVACDANTRTDVQATSARDEARELDASSSPTGGTDAQSDASAERNPPVILDPQARDTQDLPLELNFEPDICPRLDVEINFLENEYVATGGVLVKALQVPEFTLENKADVSDMDYSADVPYEDWDHSDFPEGACIVRLRGVVASCYDNPGSSFIHRAGMDRFPDLGVGLESYYQLLAMNAVTEAVPGCPRVEWGGGQGHWWYLLQRDEDTLLIGCASACEATMRWGGELTLRPDPLL